MRIRCHGHLPPRPVPIPYLLLNGSLPAVGYALMEKHPTAVYVRPRPGVADAVTRPTQSYCNFIYSLMSLENLKLETVGAGPSPCPQSSRPALVVVTIEVPDQIGLLCLPCRPSV